jgi:hypothetical protein
MFKKISMLSVCLLMLCTVRAEQAVAVPSEPVGSGFDESLTLAPKPRAKRVSQATLRNDLIDVCEAFAHQLIAEVTQVSVLFERQVCRKKQNETAQACLVTAADNRCTAVSAVLEFFGLSGDDAPVCASCPGNATETSRGLHSPRLASHGTFSRDLEDTPQLAARVLHKALVCAQARWTRALAQVQEVLLTQVRLLLEQDAQGHFYGATKDELRKAKGSIESFMKDSIDCIANLKTELSGCSSRDNRSKKQSL